MIENKASTDSVKDNNPSKKPDDTGIIMVDGFIRVYDPNTQQVFVEVRT
jgi:hypothetical protein